MTINIINIIKILSIVVPILIVVAYFTIAKSSLIKEIKLKKNPSLIYERIGFYYFVFGFSAGCLGLIITIYLKLSIIDGNSIFKYNPQTFDTFIMGHSVVMIFFFSMLLLVFKFTYILLPLVLKLKKSDMVFPKTTIFSFWLLVVGFVIFLILLILKIYFHNEWVIEIPFFNLFFQNLDFLVASIYCCIVSYFLILTTFIATLYNSDFSKFPLYILSVFITVMLLLSLLPIVTSITSMIYFDYFYIKNTTLPWTNLFLLFYHPFLFLPSMGMISNILLKIGKASSFNIKLLIYNFWFIGFLTYVLWFLYLFILNNPFNIEVFILSFRIFILFPIFCTLINLYYILWNSSIKLNVPILFALGGVISLFLGMVTSFVLSLYDKNIFYNIDYVYTQFHYLTVIISIFAIFAGFYSCPKRILKVYLSETLGYIHFWTFFIGSNLAFFPVFYIGVKNIDYNIVYFSNCISLFGFSLLIISFFIFLLVLVEALIFNRIKKDSTSNQNYFYFIGNKLDFVISISYCLLFAAFFSIAVINRTYWLLFIYFIFIVVILILNILPKVKYYFSPVIIDSAITHSNYKTDWAVLYYTIQIFKIIFMALMIYVMLCLKVTASEVLALTRDGFVKEILLKEVLLVNLLHVMLPVFGVSIIIETILKLYLTFFKNNSTKLHSINVKEKKYIRHFSTAVAAGVAKKFIKKVSVYKGPIMSQFGSKVTQGVGLTFLGMTGFTYFATEGMDNLPTFLKGTPNYFQKLNHLHFKYGFIIEDGNIHSKYDFIQEALGFDGAKQAVKKHLGNSNILTLDILDKVIHDPENQDAFNKLSTPEKIYLGLDPFKENPFIKMGQEALATAKKQLVDSLNYPFVKTREWWNDWWYSNSDSSSSTNLDKNIKPKLKKWKTI